MTHHDQILQELQGKVARRRELEFQKDALREQRSRLRTQVRKLDEIRRKEQADVDKLEGKSLARLLSGITGKRQERLEQEQAEAYAAAADYEAAARRLAEVERDLEQCLAEYRTLNGAEQTYARAMLDKAEAVKRSDTPAAREIGELEGALAAVKAQQAENGRLLNLIRLALNSAEVIRKESRIAEGYAAWDLLGGGVVPTVLKYEKIDDLAAVARVLQERLALLREALQDDRLTVKLGWETDRGIRTLDVLFDIDFLNPLDSHVLGDLRENKERLQWLSTRLSGLEQRFAAQQEELNSRARMFQNQISQLVKETKV